jgi:frataxin
MSAPSATRLFSQATRTASRSIIRSRQANAFHLQPCRVVPAIKAVNCSRSFSVSVPKATGLMPDTENPSTPKREPLATTLTPANITDEEFHTLSDAFLEKVHEKAEQVQEGREDVEVDYSVRNRCLPQRSRFSKADVLAGRRAKHYLPS